MAKRNKSVIMPAGIAVYPHLTNPDYKYDEAGKFSTKVSIPEADAAPFMKRIKAFYKAEAKKEGLKVRKGGLPWEDDEERPGNVLFKGISMKHNIAAKGDRPAYKQSPLLFDAAKNRLPEDTKVGGGSTIKCAVTPSLYDGFGGGVKLYLEAVQVIDLVTWEKDADAFGFDEEEGFTAATDAAAADVFGDTDEDDFGGDFDGDDEDESYDAADF